MTNIAEMFNNPLMQRAQTMASLQGSFLRLVLVLLTHTFYRLRVHGRENVPQEGGVLLTPNHPGFLSAAHTAEDVKEVVRVADEVLREMAG